MKIINDLQLLGLSGKEATIYSTLAKLGWATVLQISRHCDIKRSTIHRIIEDLRKKGLVEMQVDDKTTYYQVTEIDNFQSLIHHKETELKVAKTALHNLQIQANLFIAQRPSSTQVSFFRGKRGIQVLETRMSQLRNQHVLVFGSNKWYKVTGIEFAEQIRAKHRKNNIKISELTNISTPVKTAGGQLQAHWTKDTKYVRCCWRHRVIDPKTLIIENDINILPHSIVFYTMMGEEVVGIEIKSQSHSQLMRQLFMLAWNQAKIIDDFGEF